MEYNSLEYNTYVDKVPVKHACCLISICFCALNVPSLRRHQERRTSVGENKLDGTWRLNERNTICTTELPSETPLHARPTEAPDEDSSEERGDESR